VLTDTLQLKRISFLDVVFEGHDKPQKDEQFDADAVIAVGELKQLVPALIEGLGGENDLLAAGAALSTPPRAGAPTEAVAAEAAPWD